MNKKIMIWSGLFAAGLLTVLFRVEISRYMSDVTALFTVGGILASVAGIGMLIELYRLN